MTWNAYRFGYQFDFISRNRIPGRWLDVERGHPGVLDEVHERVIVDREVFLAEAARVVGEGAQQRRCDSGWRIAAGNAERARRPAAVERERCAT